MVKKTQTKQKTKFTKGIYIHTAILNVVVNCSDAFFLYQT